MHVIDLLSDGPKLELVDALGATYHASNVRDLQQMFDVAIECTRQLLALLVLAC